MKLILELTPERAAALKRFAEKVTFEDAKAVLYPHIDAEVRSEQAYEIIHAFADIERALDEAKVSSWPWIESGRAGVSNG